MTARNAEGLRPSLDAVRARLGLPGPAGPPMEKPVKKQPLRRNRIVYDDCGALGCDRDRQKVRLREGNTVRRKWCSKHASMRQKKIPFKEKVR